MIFPLLAAVVEIAEVLAIGLGEQRKGDHLPVGYLFTFEPAHDLLKAV